MTPLASPRSPWSLRRDQRPLGRLPRTHRRHAALGGTTSGRQPLRGFEPHDCGLHTIRVAAADAQGGADVRHGAIRRAYVPATGVRVLESLPAPGIEATMVETAAPTHGGWELGLGMVRYLEVIARTRPTQSQPHQAFLGRASLVALVVPHVRLKDLVVEAHEAVHVPRQVGEVVDPVSQGFHAGTPP